MPTVTCLMATANRRQFVPRAIRCFLSQTWAQCELLVLDDGDDRIDDLIPSDPRIRYFHNDSRLPLGQKLDYLAQIGRGDYLAFWDDDDWHGPERLERQMRALMAGADVSILEKFVGYDLPCDHAYVWEWRNFGAFADGTSSFTRRWYRNGPPFSASERHPGQAILRAQPQTKIAWLDGTDLYMQILHDSNSATTHMQGPGWIPATPAVAQLARERFRS